MATSVVIESIPKFHCEWDRFYPGYECLREARFIVSWTTNNGETPFFRLCYRHRWRARDLVQDHGIEAVAPFEKVSSSQPVKE